MMWIHLTFILSTLLFLLYSIQTIRLEITMVWIHLVLIQSYFTIHYYQGCWLPWCELIRFSYNLTSLFYYHFITFIYCKGGNYCLNMRGEMECTYLNVEDDDEGLKDDRWQLSNKILRRQDFDQNRKGTKKPEHQTKGKKEKLIGWKQ